MIPQPVYAQIPTAPTEVPIATLRVKVPHRVQQVFSHFPGIQKGSLIYVDLNAYGWYTGSAGMVTHNRGHKGLRRTARGLEDGLGKTSI